MAAISCGQTSFDQDAMRLTDTERRVIKQTIHPFDPAARVTLFGSRENARARGDDIDLVEFEAPGTLIDTVNRAEKH